MVTLHILATLLDDEVADGLAARASGGWSSGGGLRFRSNTGGGPRRGAKSCRLRGWARGRRWAWIDCRDPAQPNESGAGPLNWGGPAPLCIVTGGSYQLTLA